MRGTLCRNDPFVELFRIIPAHAGNSRGSTGARKSISDHPRACGELWYNRKVRDYESGSSPRMRGTRPARRHASSEGRIIPAHAGNSHLLVGRLRLEPDHPRACGELCLGILCQGPGCGSSPRMRGTPLNRAPPRPHQRIIPAHAGNSSYTNCNCRGYADHPRACGELRSFARVVRSAHGSSPRMRGTLVQPKS